MQVLFLARDLPLPANNGTRLRTWALLRALAAEGQSVVLLSFARPGEASDAVVTSLRRVCREVVLVPLAMGSLSAGTNIGPRIRALPRARPYSVERFASSEMRRLVEQRLGANEVDAVICDVFTSENVPNTCVPILLNHENVEHAILRRYCDVERNPAKRVYSWLEYLKMRRWERLVCARARVGLACSDVDGRILERLSPTTPSVTVPNIVDLDEVDPEAPGEEPATILFQGGMDWLPNRDAVDFFVTAIFPRVRALTPEARLVVAGRNPSPAFVASFAHVPAVRFTGTVLDMRAVIRSAAVSVAPLRIGSGTRLKIIEAAALGKPVVSTHIGAEGLDFVDGEEILLADEPVRFAEAVAGLLGDRASRRRIGGAARRRVEQSYSLSALRRALMNAITRLSPDVIAAHGAGAAGPPAP
jgi:glycosyltransferase involved in cell wall biosynthesis